jgi:hypothetical protein
MDARYPKAMLQFIVGARQALHVLALKQPCCEVGGLMAKMLKGSTKRSQHREFAPHLRKEREIPFTDVLTSVLLWIGQDRFGLIQEAVGVLKRRP